MVWKIVLPVLGILLFAVFLSFFLKRKGDKKARRIYGVAAYFALGIMCLGFVLLGEAIFSRINIMWLLLGVFCIFFIAAKLLIAPGFKAEEQGEEQKRE